MSRYCLDTSAYSHFRRGASRVVELVDRASWIGVPAVVLGELLVGFRLGGRRDRNEESLETFMANPLVDRAHVRLAFLGCLPRRVHRAEQGMS